MFEKYTEKAKKVLFLARYEASQMGSKVIASEHLLFGLLKEGDEFVQELFQRSGVNVELLREEPLRPLFFERRVLRNVHPLDPLCLPGWSIDIVDSDFRWLQQPLGHAVQSS